MLESIELSELMSDSSVEISELSVLRELWSDDTWELTPPIAESTWFSELVDPVTLSHWAVTKLLPFTSCTMCSIGTPTAYRVAVYSPCGLPANGPM
jgi:hypothetical protein